MSSARLPDLTGLAPCIKEATVCPGGLHRSSPQAQGRPHTGHGWLLRPAQDPEGNLRLQGRDEGEHASLTVSGRRDSYRQKVHIWIVKIISPRLVVVNLWPLCCSRLCSPENSTRSPSLSWVIFFWQPHSRRARNRTGWTGCTDAAYLVHGPRGTAWVPETKERSTLRAERAAIIFQHKTFYKE